MKKGFTLVEMLVVIAILGILMAMMIPAAGLVLRKAKIAQACVLTLEPVQAEIDEPVDQIGHRLLLDGAPVEARLRRPERLADRHGEADRIEAETGIDNDIRSMEKPSDHAPVWAKFKL